MNRTTLIVALLTCPWVIAVGQPMSAAPSPVQVVQAPPPSVTTLPPDQSTTALWTGDLDGMIKRRQIRVLTTYNKTGYFIDDGVERGVTYDAFRLFEDHLNARLKTGNLRVQVVFLPVGRDDLQDALLKGRGDIVAANITVTQARLTIADFSQPVSDDVKEVVVTSPGAPPIATLNDLAGQVVSVRSPSLYEAHLTDLSNALVKAGKKAITIKRLPANFEDEDVLEMISAGLIKITIVDDFLANFWKQMLPGLNVHSDIAVRNGEQVAFAMRKGSPQVKAELDAFVKQNRLGTTMGNVLFTKYLKNTQFARSATSPAELKKFDALLELFRKYGNQYGVDWLLMAAQGYQESGLNQGVHSKVGAVGVMQVMPATGKDMNVGDIRQIGPNIDAGVKYMRFMMDQYFKDEPIDDLNKGLFAFASYNAGPARVKTLRNEARQSGLNPNVWFNNVEWIASKRIGRETVQYVSNIYKYYIAYKLALDDMTDRRDLRPATLSH